MARAVNCQALRARPVRAFLWLYGYTAVSALAVASLVGHGLSQLASPWTLHSLLAAHREGSVVWSDLSWRVLEVLPQWAGIGCLWLLVALGSFAPKLNWLRCLGSGPRSALTIAQGLKLLRQLLLVRALACCGQLWCWGLGWCTGISIATLLRHNVDERFVSLLSWSPLALVAPCALAVGAQEQLVRIVLVAAQRREAAGMSHPLCGYTIREAIGTALTSTRRYPLKTVGLYLSTQALPLLLVLAFAAGMSSFSLGPSTSIRVVVHQLTVLALLALGGWWQYQVAKLLEPPALPVDSTSSSAIHL